MTFVFCAGLVLFFCAGTYLYHRPKKQLVCGKRTGPLRCTRLKNHEGLCVDNSQGGPHSATMKDDPAMEQGL